MCAAILGTGSYVPERRVTNGELVESGLATTDAWIIEHTEIRERRVAAATEATSDLATRAARNALHDAGLSADAIGLILCATSTPDRSLPSTASLIQERLGCACGAIDLNAGCSGFAYALWNGFALQPQVSQGHVLVIGADTYSRIVDWQDRGTSVFFGDGAGAAVLGPGTAGSWLLASLSGSDGGKSTLIEVPTGGSRQPATVERVLAGETHLRMDGPAVARFVMERVPQVVREVVQRAGLRIDQVDVLLLHQANGRLMRAVAREVGIDEDRLIVNLDRYGNTASASAAIALDEAARSRRLRPGSYVVIVGFGAGLAWCALCLRWGERASRGTRDGYSLRATGDAG